MTAPYRDMAVFEAVKSHWIATGCPDVLPNGVFWPSAPPGTEMPYCIFEPISNVANGNSNRSAYRELVMQFRVLDEAPDLAGDALDAILNKLTSSPLELPSNEGHMPKWERGPVKYLNLEEGVHTAFAEMHAERRVDR